MDIDVLTGNKVTVRLRDGGGTVVAKKTGTIRPHPSSVANNYAFPIRQIVSVDGVSEIIEQRERGPMLYISDDPALRRAMSDTP